MMSSAGGRGEHDRVTKPLQHFPADNRLGRIKCLLSIGMSPVATNHLLHWPDVQDIRSLPGLRPRALLKLAACDWIAERRNFAPDRASGLGKSWLACALGRKACRENMSVLYTRAPKLFADLAIADGDVCRVRYALGNDCYLRTADGRSRR